MRTIEINVTQEDIDKGCVGSSMACPVARAMQRSGLCNPTVWGATAFYSPEPGWPFGRRQVDIPDDAERAIDAYDRGEGMEPFTFTLEIPE